MFRISLVLYLYTYKSAAWVPVFVADSTNDSHIFLNIWNLRIIELSCQLAPCLNSGINGFHYPSYLLISWLRNISIKDILYIYQYITIYIFFNHQTRSMCVHEYSFLIHREILASPVMCCLCPLCKKMASPSEYRV